MREHRVTPVERGERRVLVVEFWESPARAAVGHGDLGQRSNDPHPYPRSEGVPEDYEERHRVFHELLRESCFARLPQAVLRRNRSGLPRQVSLRV